MTERPVLEPTDAHPITVTPTGRHVVVRVNGDVIAETDDALTLQESTYPAVQYVPLADVTPSALTRSDTTTYCPYKGEANYYSCRVGDRLVEDLVWEYRDPLESVSFIAGQLALYWRKADEWRVEDEQVHTHPRDPYHRIDIYPTSRHVRVLLDGECVAGSTHVTALFETGHPPRWYFPVDDVRMDVLDPSATETRCAYKGQASHFHALGHEDVAWTYREPLSDGERVRGLIAFYGERVDLELDGELQERPETQWLRTAGRADTATTSHR